jgi:ribonuclease VapC
LILDSSAVIAVVRGEPNFERLEAAMRLADRISIGAPTAFEVEMVAIRRFGRRGSAPIHRFLQAWQVEVSAFDVRHWKVAVDAFTRYGKGRRHPARLNFGDCMTYATAMVAGMPLLFTGEDFAKTDVAVA